MEGVAYGLEAVVVVVFADLGGDPEAVELAAEDGICVDDREDDSAPGELVDQFGQGLAARVVDVVDRIGVEYEPAGRRGSIDEAENLFGPASPMFCSAKWGGYCSGGVSPSARR